jgi:hypothetical protein
MIGGEHGFSVEEYLSPFAAPTLPTDPIAARSREEGPFVSDFAPPADELEAWKPSQRYGRTLYEEKTLTTPDGDASVPVEVPVWRFPGRTADVALVFGGVHGTEGIGVEIVNNVKQQLIKAAERGRRPLYTTVVIPELIAARRRWKDDPRYVDVDGHRVEPNRNFPAPGETYAVALQRGLSRPDKAELLDANNRPLRGDKLTDRMLAETRILIRLIEEENPVRAVSVHAHSVPGKRGDGPGIFVDPRHWPPQASADISLAAAMVEDAMRSLGATADRTLDLRGTSGQPLSHPFHGNFADATTNNVPERPELTLVYTSERHPPGTSFGGWAPARGITTITAELPRWPHVSRIVRNKLINVHENAILRVFLGGLMAPGQTGPDDESLQAEAVDPDAAWEEPERELDDLEDLEDREDLAPEVEDWAPNDEDYGPDLARFEQRLEDLDVETGLESIAAEGGSEEQFEAEEFARHAVSAALPDETGTQAEEVRPVPAGARPPIRTTARLRAAWSAYACAETRMVPLRLLGWTTPVNPVTVDAWRALEQALVAADYRAHRAWVYICRHISGQTTRSLHAYGLAVDIDHAGPKCNVNRATPDGRVVRFSSASTKEGRCADVARGIADTAFTPAQVAAVEAIRTIDGHQVFAWGGRWRTTKDTMHFQINVTPEELARGLRGVAPTSQRDDAPTDRTAAIIVEPIASDYAELARKILRGRKPSVGVVLSVVRLTPTGPMIDTRTEPGRWRPRLVNPPAHVVLPAEVYEIKFKRRPLPYIWILSNEEATYPVGGILFLPTEGGTTFYLVTFNVGSLDDARCTNVHHAERQAIRWIQEQQKRPPKERFLAGGIAIWNLSRRTGIGYSPCNPCCVDLTQFLTDLKAGGAVHAQITWLSLYDRNARCGHPTDAANVRRLCAAGWTAQGPGGCAPP